MCFPPATWTEDWTSLEDTIEVRSDCVSSKGPGALGAESKSVSSSDVSASLLRPDLPRRPVLWWAFLNCKVVASSVHRWLLLARGSVNYLRGFLRLFPFGFLVRSLHPLCVLLLLRKGGGRFGARVVCALNFGP